MCIRDRVVIEGLCAPRLLLDLVRDFIVFEDDAGQLAKKMAGYHQFHAVQVAVGETLRAAHLGGPGVLALPTEASAAPFVPRVVSPEATGRYSTCVPLVPLQAAAGVFGDPQHLVEDDLEWAAVETTRPLRPGMFMAQVVGRSMEPAIPDGAWCLFSAPVTGTRQGKTVLVQLRDEHDPETGQRYTVKRYQSEKMPDGESWRHSRVTLRPVNPEFEPIVIEHVDEDQIQVVAELVTVLGTSERAPSDADASASSGTRRAPASP